MGIGEGGRGGGLSRSGRGNGRVPGAFDGQAVGLSRSGRGDGRVPGGVMCGCMRTRLKSYKTCIV